MLKTKKTSEELNPATDLGIYRAINSLDPVVVRAPSMSDIRRAAHENAQRDLQDDHERHAAAVKRRTLRAFKIAAYVTPFLLAACAVFAVVNGLKQVSPDFQDDIENILTPQNNADLFKAPTP